MRVRRLLLLLIIPALIAACGGSSSSATLAKAEYIAAADELCAAASAELEELDEPTSLEDIADIAADAQAIYRRLARSLDDLGTPDEDADGAEAVLATLDEAIDDISDLIDAADAGDEDEVVRILNASEDGIADRDRLARDFGFEDCGIDTTGSDGPTTTEDPTTDDAANGGSIFGTPEEIAAEFGIDLDDYPPVNTPSAEDVSAFAEGINEGLDNALTTAEAECIARFALERASVMELGTDQQLAEGLGAAGTIDCLTLERILELDS